MSYDLTRVGTLVEKGLRSVDGQSRRVRGVPIRWPLGSDSVSRFRFTDRLSPDRALSHKQIKH
jgi:hypothetical protein